MSERPPGLLLPLLPSAVAGMAAAIVNALLRVAIIPVFVAPLVDRVVGRAQLEALPALLATAAALVVGSSAALWAQDALLGRAAATVTARWREGLYGRLLGRAPGTLPGTSGGLAARIVSDLREVEAFLQYGLGTLVAESVAVMAIVAVLATTDATATAVLALLCVPLVALVRLLGIPLERASERTQAGTEELSAHLQEGLRHHETVRAFAAGRFMLERFRPANDRTRRWGVRRSALAATQVPATQILAFGAVAGLVAVLAGSAADGRMTVGEMVAFITLVALLATPAQLLPRGTAMLRQASAAAVRLRELADGEPSAVGSRPLRAAGDSPLPDGTEPVEASVELRSVTVSHGRNPLIENASVRLEGPGLAVLVGESGTGKTTLLRLLLRFHEADGGEVLLGGRPLESWSEADLRRYAAYVPQGHDLFRGSVRENLAMGRAAGDDALWGALEAVGLADAVRTVGGLDYTLSEDGGGLSGGQRQRLALARALLSEPRVLLLDEPTSNLDEDAERAMVDLLRDQSRRRLVLAVTHRPALAEAAGILLRLDGGRLRPVREGVGR